MVDESTRDDYETPINQRSEGSLRKYTDWTGGDKSQGVSGLCKRQEGGCSARVLILTLRDLHDLSAVRERVRECVK